MDVVKIEKAESFLSAFSRSLVLGQAKPTPAHSLKLCREAPFETIDPVSVSKGFYATPTQEDGRSSIPANARSNDKAFMSAWMLNRKTSMPTSISLLTDPSGGKIGDLLNLADYLCCGF
jgi:hypothetical protein